jgi:hypothetical protein
MVDRAIREAGQIAAPRFLAGQRVSDRSGRRDSTPRPPPWQNSAAQMKDQRKLPKMSADVHVRIQSHPVVSCCFPVSCGRSGHGKDGKDGTGGDSVAPRGSIGSGEW